MCLKPRIAPVKVSILPLQGDVRFVEIINQISKLLINKFRTQAKKMFIKL